MPIKIPDDLPAAKVLEDEGVQIIREHDAIRQDIRPLRIALLNLMPEKIKTETQIARLIGATPLQIDLTLLTTASYVPTNTPREHMIAFYRPWDRVQREKFDGLIVTGAPVEEIEFEAVRYWRELQGIFDWARTNVFRTFNICWGAQAALYHKYGVPKYPLPHKLSGIYDHRVVRRGTDILRGFADVFPVPVSRYTEVRARDVEKNANLDILAESDEAGICMIQDRADGAVYMFNHLEYDTRSLSDEFQRDIKARPDTVRVPENYFPDDDPAKTPRNLWRPYGHLMIANWINHVYQNTPFELDGIGRAGARTVAEAAAAAARGAASRPAGRASPGTAKPRRRTARTGKARPA
jgi:homoserine O-succinyltransferase/O-acetyltransferase